jgi:dimethylamine/trimethylamine dehydrogenase
MGGVIAEKLQRAGCEVTLATPANEVSTWTTHTEEQFRIQQRLLELDIVLETGVSLAEVQEGSAVLESIYTGSTREVAAASVVMVTSRIPRDELYHSLVDRIDIQRIGDCDSPATIARAVYAGHRYAREMDAEEPRELVFQRER